MVFEFLCLQNGRMEESAKMLKGREITISNVNLLSLFAIDAHIEEKTRPDMANPRSYGDPIILRRTQTVRPVR